MTRGPAGRNGDAEGPSAIGSHHAAATDRQSIFRWARRARRSRGHGAAGQGGTRKNDNQRGWDVFLFRPPGTGTAGPQKKSPQAIGSGRYPRRRWESSATYNPSHHIKGESHDG